MSDTKHVRKSINGSTLLEEDEEGYYIGPKDGDKQVDIHVKFDSTHFSITMKQLDRTLEFSKQTGAFILEKGDEILKAIKENSIIKSKCTIDACSILKITNEDVPREMIDLRVWFRTI